MAVFTHGGTAAEHSAHVDHAALADDGAEVQNRAHHNDGVRADLRALADDGARLDARMQALEVQHGDGGVAGAVFHMQAVDVRGLRRKLRTERFPVAVEDMQAVPAGKNLRAGELAGRIGLQHHADGRLLLRRADEFNEFRCFHKAAPFSGRSACGGSSRASPGHRAAGRG